MSTVGSIPSVTANGAKIPLLGLGTWDLRGRVCARVVEQALRLGYRHVDTAQAYENEREVGEGGRACSVKRDEVFVTTKVWWTHFAPRGSSATIFFSPPRSGSPALPPAISSARWTKAWSGWRCLGSTC